MVWYVRGAHYQGKTTKKEEVNKYLFKEIKKSNFDNDLS